MEQTNEMKFKQVKRKEIKQKELTTALLFKSILFIQRYLHTISNNKIESIGKIYEKGAKGKCKERIKYVERKKGNTNTYII